MGRCEWAVGSDLMRIYHDTEWGVPVHEDRKLFEYLLLDSFQAGLSWSTILRKRDAFRQAFREFDPEAVANMTDADLAVLAQDPGIVRNRAKIIAARNNAGRFLEVAAEFGTFAAYFWSFVGGEAIQNEWPAITDVPAETVESRALSADLKRRGFSFVGPTIVYAVMQSAGLVNDHAAACYRRQELRPAGYSREL